MTDTFNALDEIYHSLVDMLLQKVDREALENIEGTWWCNSHGREATYICKDGSHSCQSHQGGIMIPCFVVFAPMTVEYTKPRKKRIVTKK